MKKDTYLIACPIFKDELEMALESDINLKIHFMDYRIHNDAKRMFEELTKAVSEANGNNISLLVGSDCYCEVGISDFARQISANIINEKNCIEAILGPERTDELQKDRTTIHTQGWMRMIRQSITDSGLMGDSIRMMLGYFERILLLDYGVKPYSDEDILTYYDLLQVPIEIEPVQLDYFKRVLNRLLE